MALGEAEIARKQEGDQVCALFGWDTERASSVQQTVVATLITPTPIQSGPLSLKKCRGGVRGVFRANLGELWRVSGE